MDVLKLIKGALICSITVILRITIIGTDLPLDLIIQQNCIPALVEGIKCGRPKIQFECAWILNNIATGNEEQVIIISCIH